MRRPGIIVFLCIGALLAVGCREKASHTPRTAVVKRGPLTLAVDGRGELEAEKSRNVICPKIYRGRDSWGRGGSMKIVKIIPEGADVQPGTLLVELDKADLKDNLKRAENDVREKTADQEKARKTLLVEREKLRAEVDKLRADLEIRKLEQSLTESLPLTSDMVSAETELETAQVIAAIKKQDYDPMVKLQKTGHVTLQDLEIAELDWRQAEINLKRKQLINDLVEKGADECEKKRVAMDVRLAEILLAQAQTKLEFEARKLEEDIKGAESALEQSKFEIKRFAEAVTDADVKAPCAGTVIYARVWQSSGEEKIAEGTAVWTYHAMIHLPDLNTMVAKVHVEESQIQQVKLGQQATLKMDAIKDLEFHGVVSEIGNVTMDKSESQGRVTWLYGRAESAGIRVFEVKVRIAERDKRIRPGLNGAVKIVVTEMKDTLSVPLEAVFKRNGHRIAYVKQGRGFTARRIETGMAAEGQVAVTKGLSEGDEVSLVEPEGGA